MPRFVLSFGLSLMLIIIFVIDRANTGVFSLFNYFSFSILFLLAIFNLRLASVPIFIFFLYGILVDCFNKSFLGLSSLMSLTILFLANLIRIRFASSKISLSIINFLMVYGLFIVNYGIESFFTWNAFICGIVTSFLVFPIILKDK